MAAAKKLAKEGISIWEADRWLDASIFLDKYPRWEPCGLHHPFVKYQMFAHAVVTRKKEYDWAIHWGQPQPLPKWDLSAEPSTIELIDLRSTREEIREVYNDVYQLWRSPGKSLCNAETEERTCQDILDSVKECLQCRITPSQRRDQDRVLLVIPGRTCRLNFRTRCAPHMTTTKI